MADQNMNNTAFKPKASFCDWAARFSLIMPLVATVVTFGLLYLVSSLGADWRDVLSVFLACEVVLLFASFISGATSLIGSQFYRRRFSPWIAILGVLASGAVGFVTLVLHALSEGWWSGC